MNKPSVARPCTRCEKPIATAKERAYFDGKLVGTDCLRALKAEQMSSVDPVRPFPRSPGGTGLGARLAAERRAKVADANLALRAKRLGG